MAVTEGARGVTLAPAHERDLEELVQLRLEAMRESLERVGRFDVVRARERFVLGFAPELTRHVLLEGERVGFVVLRPTPEGATLEHLYVRPARQGRGVGAAVLAIVFGEADRFAAPLRVGALRGSDSNRFYQRYEFVRVEEGEWDTYYVRPPCPALCTIRSEGSGDAAAIRALHEASFPSAAEARLVDALRGSGQLSCSLVAVEHERVVGHVAFSPVTASGTTQGLGLAPLAVLPDRRRHGVGARLVRAGLRRCQVENVPLVVVLGDPAYYARFGFQPALRWALRDEYRSGAAFQALELVAGTVPAGGGLVQYSADFAALGG